MSKLETALRASDPVWETLDSHFDDDTQPMPPIVAQLHAIVRDVTPLYIQTRLENADRPGEIKVEVFAIWENLVTGTACADTVPATGDRSGEAAGGLAARCGAGRGAGEFTFAA